ncbi:MAG TPA: PIG-L deacetylase family protein [Egibacteraceae bacterium]
MEPVERVLVVCAHPDDIDFGASGSVAGWTDAGIEVTYCLVTDGDAGGFDREVPREEIPRIRRAEQIAAAAVVGVTDVRFLGYPDGRLTPSLELRRDLSRVIRQVRPQRVVCQSPERNWASVYASHPDHRAAGEATLDAVYPDARNPFAHPELLQEEGLEPHIVHEVWVMGGPQPDHYVDVTDQFERKVAALREHRSQLTDPTGEPPAVLRDLMRRNAEAGGLPEGRLAEAFKVVHIPA